MIVLALANGDDLAALRLFLGIARENQTGCGGLFRLILLDDDSIAQRLQIHLWCLLVESCEKLTL